MPSCLNGLIDEQPYFLHYKTIFISFRNARKQIRLIKKRKYQCPELSN